MKIPLCGCCYKRIDYRNLIRTRESYPWFGDKIWVADRLLSGKQPNGYVSNRRWEDGELIVTVHFYNTMDVEDYESSELKDKWCDTFGGTYIIQE